jgi:hypothetical protein
LTFPVTALVRGEADIDGLFVGVDFDPRLDNLRATAAFQDFARRAGLPQ